MYNRLKNLFNEKPLSRLNIIFGSGVEDIFLDEEFELVSIEKALHQELIHFSFDRIIFSSPTELIKFLDLDSERMTHLEIPKKSQRKIIEMKNLDHGPFNKLMVIEKPDLDDAIPMDWNAMKDIHAIRFIDSLLRDESCRTLIIFSHSEVLLNQFDDTRILAGLIGNWTRLSTNNQNSCIFTFSAGTFDQLRDLSQTLVIPEIRTIIQNSVDSKDSQGIYFVSTPEKDEIQRALQQFLETKQIIGEELLPSKLLNNIFEEKIPLRIWISRFATVNYLDIETIRRQGWFSGELNSNFPAIKRLNNLIGAKNIKQRIHELTALVQLESKNNPIEISLHMIFSGNPGTGKTTVARLVGEILRDIGYLKRGHLVECSPGNLVGDVVGATSKLTNKIIDSALDGVLFIDEAYGLIGENRGGYGLEALEILMQRMENDRARLVVILAGYPELMDKFIKANPGLSRRISVENIIQFEDFCPDELEEILYQNLDQLSLQPDNETNDALKKVVDGIYKRRDAHFGNAGEIRNIAEAIQRKYAVRISDKKLPRSSEISVADIPDGYKNDLKELGISTESILKELDELIGLGNVKKYIRKLVYQLQYDDLRAGKSANAKKPNPQHLVFSGNPGTGKTTVARLVGKIYKSMGLLSKGHCIEVSRSDLVAGYVGQSAIQTKEKIMLAIGGVLFIDEAYSLLAENSSDYGSEVVDTLVKYMEDYRDKFVVIVAGYPEKILTFINSNPGLKSRFADPIVFDDFSEKELKEILIQKIRSENFLISIDTLKLAVKELNAIRLDQPMNFGNGRSVREFFGKMKGNLAMRIMDEVKAGNIDFGNKQIRTFKELDLPHRLPANAIYNPMNFALQPIKPENLINTN